MRTVKRTRDFLIRYPRRVLVRSVIRAASHLLGPIVARPQVNGLENLPEKGPLILVGNHVAVIEAGMMATYVPYNVELMAAGDIPLDPRYAWLADLYGVLPIKRGQMDRGGLNLALDILEQGGVVGMFPEGGIWETNLRDARTGVAWLSHMAQAPIAPIGFVGIEGAVTAIAHLKRPRIQMNIGKLIPPINLNGQGVNRKQALVNGANMIMSRIKELVPDDHHRSRPVIDETFDFQVVIRTPAGVEFPAPPDADIVQKQALSKIFHRPVMLDVFSRNLKIWVRPLLEVQKFHPPADVARAVQNMLDYLETNPYFFHYRFGHEQGDCMVEGLEQLRDLARWAHDEQKGYTLRLRPITTYRYKDTGEYVETDIPPRTHPI